MPAIYVEILIRAPMDELWKFTQDPAIHEKWDLRFTSITYLPRPSEAEPQRFRYATRIGFGLQIAGEGESTGERDLSGGARISSLKFSSADSLSLIEEGGGYWKYIPTADGIRFLTLYDYRTRFGLAGKLTDSLIFRPILGWATAWSFDSMRLWIERGIHPTSSRILAATHALSRLALASVFAWHGLVPKLLHQSPDELILLGDSGVPIGIITRLLTSIGIAEIIFSLILLICWRQAWPAILIIILMLIATVGISINSPTYVIAAFNPISLNFCVVILSIFDLLTLRNLPTAARCLRKDPGAQV